MKKLKLASHNTMTYLPVKQWWLKPFAWMAKCQSKELYDQHKAGAIIYDFRVKPIIKFDELNMPYIEWQFGHGLITYKLDEKFHDVYKVFSALDSYAFRTPTNVYGRILLEYNKRDAVIEEYFKRLCNYLETTMIDTKWCGGQTKADWSTIYNFKNSLPTIVEHYSSMPSNPKWYGIWPWLYAKLTNNKIIKKCKNDPNFIIKNKSLMIDFI